MPRPPSKVTWASPPVSALSVNEEIVHGIPGKRVLQEGDIIKMDVGATIQGFIGDAAVSVAVGKVRQQAIDLMDATRESLAEGIKAAQPGNRIGDIGLAVQTYGEAHGYGVVREFVGHGVGRHLHEEPQVPNYRDPTKGPGPCCGLGCASPLSRCLTLGDGKPAF